MKHCTIPDTWSGKEALAFVAFLDRLSQAVWRAHGGSMARCLMEHDDADGDVRRPNRPRLIQYDNGPTFDYEPIPFPER